MFEGEIPNLDVPEVELTTLDKAKQLAESIERKIRAGENGELVFDDGKSVRFQSLVIKMIRNAGERRSFGTKRVISFTKMTYVPLTNKPYSETSDTELQKLPWKPQDIFATRVSIAWNENRNSFYCYAEKLRYHRTPDFQFIGEPETIGTYKDSTLMNPVMISQDEALQILTNMDREIDAALRERYRLQYDGRTKLTEQIPDIE